MIEHHIQKDILAHLVKAPSARFAELKPANVEGNIFTYHLHQLVQHGYVEKHDDGTYCLTSLGKAAGINRKLNETAQLLQAHSVLLLAARDTDGRWLLRRRLVHPMYGKVGFVHAEPQVNEPVTATAKHVFEHKTGLSADFQMIGSGYIRLFQNDQLESFTHFSLLFANNVSGELLARDETGENTWYDKPDFNDSLFIPSMSDIAKLLDSPAPFLIELEYHLTSAK